MFSEKNHTSTSSGFAAGTLGIVQASGHAAGITASPVQGKAPNAPGQSKNTEKTQLVRRLPKARRFFRSRNIRKPPKPSPMQGKVAKTIFRENCFRRMRWNIGVLLRYTKRSPIHRGIPNIHRSANARLTSAKANPLPHMSHLHTSTSSGNRSFTRCISTLRPPMNIVKMVFQMKL